MTVTIEPFTSPMVTAITGCSYRQLDWWCSLGWVAGQPADVGSGRRRTFTEPQVRIVAGLRVASDAGMERHLKRIAARLADADWDRPLHLVITDRAAVILDLPEIVADIDTRKGTR